MTCRRRLSIVGVIVLLVLTQHDASAQRDTSAVMDIPAPEEGVIRIHFGPPVGIRPVPAQAASGSHASADDRDRAPAVRAAPLQAAASYSDYWLEATDRGPALIFLNDDPLLPPDTLFLTDAAGIQNLDAVQAPPVRGLDVPQDAARARIAAPDGEVVERMLLDHGLFRTLALQFEFDRSTLLPIAEPTLDAIADVLRRHPELQLEIGGHTDDTGAAAYNRQLSQQRAEAVRESLLRRGAEPERLSAVGYGEDAPLLPNTSQTHRVLNRRVEFRLLENGAGERSHPAHQDEELLDALRESLREALRESMPGERRPDP